MDIELMENDQVCLLCEELGMQGFGILVALLLTLEKKNEKRCNVKLIKGIARSLNVQEEFIIRVIKGYNLFAIEELNGESFFYAEDLSAKEYTKRNKTQQRGGANRANHADRDAKGRFTGLRQTDPIPMQLEENQIIQLEGPAGTVPNPAHNTTKTTNNLPTALSPGWGEGRGEGSKRWIKHVDQAMEDSYWLEMIAMQTKLPVFKRKTEIVMHFKRHVIAQGTEDRILSVKDAKNYFANYTRIGKPTYKDLIRELNRKAERKKNIEDETDIYRYENRNPITGERSYFGVIIPPEAPPRPNEEAVLINGLWQ